MNDTKGFRDELLKADGIKPGGVSLKRRDVLQCLRFMEDVSYEGIAAVFGCSIGTVRSRVRYAKRAACSILEDNSHE